MNLYRLNEANNYRQASNWDDADWIRFDCPTTEEIDDLHRKTGIPRDFITSALDPYEIPRQESFTTQDGEKVDLIIIQYPLEKPNEANSVEYETLPLGIILHPTAIFTISSKNLPLLDDIALNNFPIPDTDLAHGKIENSHLILKILWKIINQYIQGITKIDETIESLEKNIMKTTKKVSFHHLISIHKSLVYFDTGITKNHDQVKRLNEIDSIISDKLDEELLHDITVYSSQAASMAVESEDLISHLSQIFSSTISHNLNIIMKVLTSLTILLAVPEVIGALWGMNVPVPLQEHPSMFTLLISAIIGISVLMAIWFKKNDFL